MQVMSTITGNYQFSEADIKFIDEHFLIISALYGT